MQTCHCPSCGKSFILADPSRSEAFCQYCGEKIILTPPSSNFTHIHTEHTERFVDEAELQRAKNENRIIGAYTVEAEEYRAQKEHERQMEVEERQYQREKEKNSANVHSGLLTIAVLFVIAFFCGYMIFCADDYTTKAVAAASHTAELNRLSREKEEAEHLAKGEVKMPAISTTEDARDVLKKLRDAGFINIVDTPVKLSLFGSLKNTLGFEPHDNYEIIEITVDGAPTFKSYVYYAMDTEIVVSYYVTE